MTAFEAILDHWNPYEKVNGPGFRIWRPANPDGPEPIDRASLESFVRTTVEDGCISARRPSLLERDASALIGVWRAQLSHALPDLAKSPELRLPGSGVRKLIGAVSQSDWDAVVAGQVLTAGQMNLTGKLLEFFDGELVQGGDLPDMLRHPAELYVNGSFESTPIRIVHTGGLVYRVIDAQGRKTRWNPQAPGISEFRIGVSFIDGKAVMKESRDQFESECNQRFSFQTGLRAGDQLVIGLPGGLSLTYNLPSPVAEVSDPKQYSDLPEALRDKTWANIVKNAMSGAQAQGGGS